MALEEVWARGRGHGRDKPAATSVGLPAARPGVWEVSGLFY